MSTVLDDQFNRSGFILGSSASPTGGTWSAVVTSHYAGGDYSLTGSAFVIPGSSGEDIFSLKNSALFTTIEGSATLNFTPATDGWAAGIVIHADSDSYPCWIAWVSGGNAHVSRFDSASDSVATNLSGPWTQPVAAGNRSAHTLTVDVASDGTITISVDGTPVSGATIDDAALTTAGRWGVMGRGVSIDAIVASDGAAGPASDLTGAATGDDGTPTGTLSTGASILTGTVTGADGTPTGTLSSAMSTVTTLPFTRNPGNGGRVVSIANVALAVLSDDANLNKLAGSTGLLMGSDGRVTLANGVPAPAGTSVVVLTREPDGKLGVERYVLS